MAGGISGLGASASVASRPRFTGVLASCFTIGVLGGIRAGAGVFFSRFLAGGLGFTFDALAARFPPCFFDLLGSAFLPPLLPTDDWLVSELESPDSSVLGIGFSSFFYGVIKSVEVMKSDQHSHQHFHILLRYD